MFRRSAQAVSPQDSLGTSLCPAWLTRFMSQGRDEPRADLLGVRVFWGPTCPRQEPPHQPPSSHAGACGRCRPRASCAQRGTSPSRRYPGAGAPCGMHRLRWGHQAAPILPQGPPAPAPRDSCFLPDPLPQPILPKKSYIYIYEKGKDRVYT